MPRGRERHPYRAADAYGRRARREGYPARSVYKLQEIDRRLGLLRPGMRVLDLGAAPGSWTLYAAQRVGSEGVVVAVDLEPLRTAVPGHVRALQGDVFELEPEALPGRPFDVVLSDLAPATSGHREVDQARSARLAERALQIATQVLSPGGALVAKLLQGPELQALQQQWRRHFARVRRLRPRATRSRSTELYLVGLGKCS